MKKIGIITTNRIFAQSLCEALLNSYNNIFQPYLLLNPDQVLLDVDILEIDVAVIVAMDGDRANASLKVTTCRNMRNQCPNLRIIWLVSQEDEKSRLLAMEALHSKVIDDFVFYDTTLQYLFAKLDAL